MTDYSVAVKQTYNIRLLSVWFLYTTFSGAVRKWVFTDTLTGNIILGIQIGFPILFVLLAKTKRLNPTILTILIAYSMLLVLMAFNPLAQTLAHGVVGYFLHISVFFPLLIYMNDREAFPIERLNRLLIAVMLIEVVLGIIQFLYPADSFINKYVRDVSLIGGIATLPGVNRVRIAGTFSYIGGMTSLFTVYGFIVWGLRLTRKSPVLIAMILVCCGIISPMTGSRGLTGLLIILISYGFLSTVTELRSSIGLIVIGIIVLFAAQFINLSLVGEAYSGLNGRIQGHAGDGENRSRIVGQVEEIINFRGNYPLFGTGLGGTYQGSIALFGESITLKDYGYYEEEPERVILEGGYLLFFVRLLLWLIIFKRSSIPLLSSLLLVYLHVFFQVTLFNVFTGFYTIIGLMYLDRCYLLRQQECI